MKYLWYVMNLQLLNIQLEEVEKIYLLGLKPIDASSTILKYNKYLNFNKLVPRCCHVYRPPSYCFLDFIYIFIQLRENYMMHVVSSLANIGFSPN